MQLAASDCQALKCPLIFTAERAAESFGKPSGSTSLWALVSSSRIFERFSALLSNESELQPFGEVENSEARYISGASLPPSLPIDIIFSKAALNALGSSLFSLF